jgi:uncharacterized membrane protein YkgB
MASHSIHDNAAPGGMRDASAGATPLTIAEHLIDGLFAAIERIWAPFLRISLAVILIWIGALKFVDPTPIVGLLHASPLWGFLATNTFVYVLGVLELVGALFLLINRAVRYVGLLVVLLFVGTLSILATAPTVSFSGQGFPYLTLAGQFLLKDLGLAAAAIAAVARDARQHRGMDEPAPRPS